MKRFFILFAVILLFPSLVLASNTTIEMTKDGFEPKDITINSGDTVTFENTDTQDHWPASNIHPTHEIYPEFDPKKPINPADAWEFKFDKGGEWRFHDHLDPQFLGTIIVKDASGSQSIQTTPVLSDIPQKSLFSKLTLKIGKWWNSLFKKKKPDFDCISTDFNCISQRLEAETAKSGPQKATEMLQDLLNEKKISTTIDDHQFSHRIGRQTAKSFGMDAESFLTCPMSAFNGGCQHGFFEYALGQANNAKEAAEKICEPMQGQYSSKDYFYCYHGVGHGVLMARAYDLNASLDICNSLSKSIGQDGCWQGVFMENVNVGMKGEAREGIFSKSDPLAPCDNVEDKYKNECYINHAGYLMVFYKNSFEQASLACLKAGSYNQTCIHSLGLLTTNPSWQYLILGKSDNKDGVDLALDICGLVPEELRKNCLIGGLDNILNNDEMNLELRALKYCQKVERWGKSECYSQIGININRQVIDKNKKLQLCNKVDKAYINSCIASAGI